MADEWTPWITHDGSGLPVPCGTYVRRQFDCPALDLDRITQGPVMQDESYVRCGEVHSWDGTPEMPQVIRYRIRRPPALCQLIDMVENLPVEVDA